MNALNMTAIVLIVIGALGLAYGGFSYDGKTTEAQLGPIHMSVTETQRVNIPIWAGIGAIAMGGVLLVVGSRRG